uniref:ATP-dependent RNA helicase DHX34 n=1 Tax=Rhabditophanes sp. KR3021 TaxID=114890 RepID=A0AC35U4Y5_9BILA
MQNKLNDLKKSQKELPVFAKKDAILEMVKENQVLILAGETGSGKSTQIPQYLLNCGYENICVTQPRKIACKALAQRVAYESMNENGTVVGYSVRFEKSRTARTKLLFVTDGLLLRQMSSDKLLTKYDVIILDEVHERHVDGDIILGLLKKVLAIRPDLKLILMSATINVDLFQNYFPEASFIEVPGKLHPVELRYLPPKSIECSFEREKKKSEFNVEPYIEILGMIEKSTPVSERGDVLIFLNGLREMSKLAAVLKDKANENNKWIILMLHSMLSIEEQDKVFDLAPIGVRKCILSTNIAETSVTIDGIRFVVDSGKSNELTFDHTNHVHLLKESWISKASSNQRLGRAGRTGPGVCYRIYSKEQYEKMEPFNTSEINRISLQNLCLKIMNVSDEVDPREFDFIEKPDSKSLNFAMDNLRKCKILQEIEAPKLTHLGLILANLPTEIEVGKVVIYSKILSILDIGLTLAAGLEMKTLFVQASFNNLDTIDNRKYLLSRLGDTITLIKVYGEWLNEKYYEQDTTRWCKKLGIEQQRLYEVVKLRNQLKEILRSSEHFNADTFESDEEETATRADRKIKHGERRKLEQLKREARNEKTMIFKSRSIAFEVLEKAIKIREKLDDAMRKEFNKVKGTKSKSLHEMIISYAKLDVEFQLKRLTTKEYTTEGGIYEINDQGEKSTHELINVIPIHNDEIPMEEDDETTEVDLKKKKIIIFCDGCDKNLSFKNSIDFLRHKKKHH